LSSASIAGAAAINRAFAATASAGPTSKQRASSTGSAPTWLTIITSMSPLLAGGCATVSHGPRV
jgi:hypothetical protein